MEQSQRIIRVIAALVDQRQLTLYKEDGSTKIILQGDPRLAGIVQTITPILADGNGAVAEVDISKIKGENPYGDFESLVGKAIQFFRVDKSKLESWLGKAAALVSEVIKEVAISDTKPTVLPMTLGPVPSSKGNAETLLSAAEEIIAHAQPADHPDFDDKNTGTTGDQTIVAVVGNHVVGDVEKLKPQLTRAVQTNSSVGMTAFLTRAAAVASERRHSVQDLLSFLERSDLPIADDGSIVVYKMLRRREMNSGSPKVLTQYVDCYTGLVPQKIGAYVCMDPSLVDPNRSVDCSNGLHVARRAYLSGFSGDVVVLAKVRPEDVIAVPYEDANKMRVCGYHILFELSDEAFALLRANKPFTDNSTAKLLLGKALAGDHSAPSVEVKITQHKGQGVVITPIKGAKVAKAIEVKPTEALSEANLKVLSPVLDPKTVVKEIDIVKKETKSRSEQANVLYAEFVNAKSNVDKAVAANRLMGYKRLIKLGWTALGLPDTTGELLKVYL